jgi:two-component system NtrC family sensor kinase
MGRIKPIIEGNRQSEAAFRAEWDAEAALAVVSDSVSSGVLIFGPGGELRAMNSRFAELLGHEKDELTGRDCFENLVDALAGEFVDPIAAGKLWRRRREAGEPCWDELELVSPNSGRLERFGRPILDRKGRRAGWAEVYRAVPGRKLIHGDLRHIERMVTLGQLLSGVAHELSNPLTSILGYAQLLLRRRPDIQGAEDAERILVEAERANRITRGLLQFARRAKAERSALGLGDLVRSAISLRAGELGCEQIEVYLDIDPDLPPVLGDAAQLQQVFLNLLLNAEQAIRHGRGSGSIHLRTRRASRDRLAIEVADDGPGISPEIVNRIFDPFFTIKPSGIGTGLGLSIAYGIVHDHGGKIAVESRPGGGALFTVELPVAPAPPQAARSLARQDAKGRAAATPIAVAPVRSERILVIEDEPAVASLIADVLREQGHQVDVALDSREGMALMAGKSYALVLCDLRMPHLSGRDLFEESRRRHHSLCRRFVFVTGDVLSSDTAQFLKSSGVPYLAKPFLIGELKAIVQQALSRDTVLPLLAAPARAGLAHGGQKRQRAQR